MPSRRNFLAQATALTGGMLLPWRSLSTAKSVSPPEKLTFGLVADPHHDIMHDTEERMEDFLSAASARDLDFIINLGDFCHPIAKNKPFLGLWNQYRGPKHHVLGNHEMDLGSKEQNIDFYEMKGRYYSFDHNGYHFIVLDANNMYIDGKFVHYDNSNFYAHPEERTWIDEEQIEWLQSDLVATTLPCIVFCHQSLENNAWGVKNRVRIQELFERENERAAFQKVIACFNGHNHIDYCRRVNGIYYIDINSMSYQWLGADFEVKSRYNDPKLYEQYPHLGKVAPYQDALYSFVQVGHQDLTITGRSTAWIAPSPRDLNFQRDLVIGYEFTPEISDRLLKF